jgi:methoxymalonate biosynthesis acyl carrier protein
MSLNEKIRSFILENLMVFDEEEEFSDSDNIFQLGYVNSLFAIKLLNYVEKEFNIVIENEEMDISNFSSVSAIVHLVEKKIRPFQVTAPCL